ncbi:group 1 glycosyl transferase [Salinisphaera sp. PC39]
MERESLGRLAESLGITTIVRFEGFLPFDQLVDTLVDCDISVLPSRFEGLGMAAIEAMALGIPTVTADFEASADFIQQGVTGHTFPRGDAVALARVLGWHRENPDRVTLVAENGRRLVHERFRPDVVFRPIIGAYGLNDLLDNGRHRSLGTGKG